MGNNASQKGLTRVRMFQSGDPGADERFFMQRRYGRLYCTVQQGYDQPAEFDLYDMPLILRFSYECCAECVKMGVGSNRNRNCLSAGVECKSWVFKRNKKECFLKKDYNASRNIIPCEGCIAYNPAGRAYMYQSGVGQGGMPHNFSGPFAIGGYGEDTERGKLSEGETHRCAIIPGFDQPTRFNLKRTPVQLPSPADCCDACRDRQSESSAWRLLE